MNHRAELLPLQISQSFLWLFQYLPTVIQVASDSYSDLRGEIKTKKERRFVKLILDLTWAHDCITMLTPHTLTDWLTGWYQAGHLSVSSAPTLVLTSHKNYKSGSKNSRLVYTSCKTARGRRYFHFKNPSPPQPPTGVRGLWWFPLLSDNSWADCRAPTLSALCEMNPVIKPALPYNWAREQNI